MSCHFAALPGEALLPIAGPDSMTFLQGQTTCDTSQVDQAHAVVGAYCTPQGRVVCDFLLCQLEQERFALRMRADTTEAASTTFGKYIVFSKAELGPVASGWKLYGLWGQAAREVLESVFQSAPGEALGSIGGTGWRCIQIDAAGEQFECYIDCEAQAQLAQQLQAAATAAPEDHWRALQIAAGRGRVEAATSGEFIPQMLNYDLTGQVNFNKGCYTGQEVVARMHYRGKPKRRMYLAAMEGDAKPGAGTPLFSAGSEQSVGNVVNSALSPQGAVAALVVATATGAENGLHLGAADGPLLRLGELPYALESG